MQPIRISSEFLSGSCECLTFLLITLTRPTVTLLRELNLRIRDVLLIYNMRFIYVPSTMMEMKTLCRPEAIIQVSTGSTRWTRSDLCKRGSGRGRSHSSGSVNERRV